MMQFQTDYVIAWDFSDHDAPCVTVSRLYSDKKSVHLMVDALGMSHEKCGVVSLRQLIDDFEREHDREAEDDA